MTMKKQITIGWRVVYNSVKWTTKVWLSGIHVIVSERQLIISRLKAV